MNDSDPRIKSLVQVQTPTHHRRQTGAKAARGGAFVSHQRIDAA